MARKLHKVWLPSVTVSLSRVENKPMWVFSSQVHSGTKHNQTRDLLQNQNQLGAFLLTRTSRSPGSGLCLWVQAVKTSSLSYLQMSYLNRRCPVTVTGIRFGSGFLFGTGNLFRCSFPVTLKLKTPVSLKTGEVHPKFLNGPRWVSGCTAQTSWSGPQLHVTRFGLKAFRTQSSLKIMCSLECFVDAHRAAQAKALLVTRSGTFRDLSRRHFGWMCC